MTPISNPRISSYTDYVIFADFQLSERNCLLFQRHTFSPLCCFKCLVTPNPARKVIASTSSKAAKKPAKKSNTPTTTYKINWTVKTGDPATTLAVLRLILDDGIITGAGKGQKGKRKSTLATKMHSKGFPLEYSTKPNAMEVGEAIFLFL